MPSTRVRGARGMTRISRRTAGLQTADCDLRLGRPRRSLDARGFGAARRLVGLARTVEQELSSSRARLVLVAHELERAIERLDRRFERALGVAAPQLQLVDVVIELLEPDLRLLQQQVGAPLRLADDQLGLGLRRSPSARRRAAAPSAACRAGCSRARGAPRAAPPCASGRRAADRSRASRARSRRPPRSGTPRPRSGRSRASRS